MVARWFEAENDTPSPSVCSATGQKENLIGSKDKNDVQPQAFS